MAGYLDYMTVGGMMAALAGMALIGTIIGLLIYCYTAFALMTIAKKTKTANPWLAWIPVANLYLVTQIAKVSEFVHNFLNVINAFQLRKRSYLTLSFVKNKVL